MKNNHRWNIVSNLGSGQQYLSNDMNKIRQKWLFKKSKFVWRKKNHPEHQYSVTFVSNVGTISHLSKGPRLIPLWTKRLQDYQEKSWNFG